MCVCVGGLLRGDGGEEVGDGLGDGGGECILGVCLCVWVCLLLFQRLFEERTEVVEDLDRVFF